MREVVQKQTKKIPTVIMVLTESFWPPMFGGMYFPTVTHHAQALGTWQNHVIVQNQFTILFFLTEPKMEPGLRVLWLIPKMYQDVHMEPTFRTCAIIDRLNAKTTSPTAAAEAA